MSVVINGSAGVTTNSGAVYNGIQAGTAVASTSGTSVEFTGIPSWVKRVTVMFNGVSTNGGSIVQVQLGSGSFVTTGYEGSASTLSASSVSSSNYTSGFAVGFGATAQVLRGALTIFNISSNSWTASGVTSRSESTATLTTAGGISLSGVLDRVRITTVNGTDTFDAGSINILYE